ncbi:unnamed protein product, partial [Polarella glacialis]
VYASQASRSPRSLSPMRSSAFDSFEGAATWGDGGGGATSSTDPGWGAGPSEEPRKEPNRKKDKKKSRKKQTSEGDLTFGREATDFGFGADRGFPSEFEAGFSTSHRDEPAIGSFSPSRHHAASDDVDELTRVPDFGASSSFDAPAPAATASQPVEHLEALIEAEKRLVKQLRQDLEEHNQELLRLEEACRLEERETTREREQGENVDVERRQLQQQLESSQRQLVELKHEHQELHRESVMLRRDHGHYTQEAVFLQRLVDEGFRETQVLQQTIEYLEQSNQSLEAHTRALEEARRGIAGKARAEQELLQRAQGGAAAAKQALETLRNGGGLPSAASSKGSVQPASVASRPSLGEAPPWSGGLSILEGTGAEGLGGGLAMPRFSGASLAARETQRPVVRPGPAHGRDRLGV